VKGVFRKQSFGYLPVIVTIDEKLNVLGQALHSSGETSGFACQALEVMTEIGIDRLDRIGLLFVGAHLLGSAIVEGVIGRQGIRVILFGLGCPLQAGLQGFRGALRNYIPAQHAAGVSIHDG